MPMTTVFFSRCTSTLSRTIVFATSSFTFAGIQTFAGVRITQQRAFFVSGTSHSGSSQKNAAAGCDSQFVKKITT